MVAAVRPAAAVPWLLLGLAAAPGPWPWMGQTVLPPLCPCYVLPFPIPCSLVLSSSSPYPGRPATALGPWWQLCVPLRRLLGGCCASCCAGPMVAAGRLAAAPGVWPWLYQSVIPPLCPGYVLPFPYPCTLGLSSSSPSPGRPEVALGPWWQLCVALRRLLGGC